MTTHRTMVKRIRACYSSATPQQRADGARWYANAHDVACQLFGDVDTGAGVLAALSPLTPWQRNVQLARMVADGVDPATLPTLGASRTAAGRIAAGESWQTVLRGPKVRAFCAGIITAGETETVCVDRHARDIAYGQPFHGIGHKRADGTNGAVTAAEYRAIARAYVAAARAEGIGPAILQAVCWTAHRGTAE